MYEHTGSGVGSDGLKPTTVVAINESGLSAVVTAGRHQFKADEPVLAGGGDTATTPIGLLLGALASCTVITVRMYAERKQWAAGEIRATATGRVDQAGVMRSAAVMLEFVGGTLDDAQRRRLREIAGKCPVHKTLAAGVAMEVQYRGSDA